MGSSTLSSRLQAQKFFHHTTLPRNHIWKFWFLPWLGVLASLREGDPRGVRVWKGGGSHVSVSLMSSFLYQKVKKKKKTTSSLTSAHVQSSLFLKLPSFGKCSPIVVISNFEYPWESLWEIWFSGSRTGVQMCESLINTPVHIGGCTPISPLEQRPLKYQDIVNFQFVLSSGGSCTLIPSANSAPTQDNIFSC